MLSRCLRARAVRARELAGGESRNAIPREASATVLVSATEDAGFRDAARKELSVLLEEHAGTDDGLGLAIEAAEADPATEDSTRRALDLIAAIPTGDGAMPSLGTVETSSASPSREPSTASSSSRR